MPILAKTENKGKLYLFLAMLEDSFTVSYKLNSGQVVVLLDIESRAWKINIHLKAGTWASMVALFIIQNFGDHGSTHREPSTQKVKSDKSHVKTSRFMENLFFKETYILYSGCEQNVSWEVSEFKCPWHQDMQS